MERKSLQALPLGIKAVSVPSTTNSNRIKTFLGLPKRALLPRCPAKDQRKLRALRAEGDLSHDDENHICDKCGCSRVAGSGTKGEFYGFLDAEHGHYGCGFCRVHERGHYAKGATEKAERHAQLLREFGMSEDRRRDYMEIAKREAEEAQGNIEARDAIELVRKHLDEFREITEGEEKKLTEYAGGKLCPMSDQTRMDMAMKIAKALTDLAKDKFDLDADRYISVDEVVIKVKQMLTATERYIIDEESRQSWMMEQASIWKSLGQPKKKL